MSNRSTDLNAARFDSVADDVFSRIASRYDVLCDLFSFGVHRIWKSRMARRIVSEEWETMLDVAAGTGDIALRVVRHLGATRRNCVVSDICPAMLDIARRRAGVSAEALQFRMLDAHQLSVVHDASIDLYSMSFGMKICDRTRAVAEAWRVLKPGGTFICLEASEIPIRVVHRLYLAYMKVWCLPMIGWAATGGDASAFHYLLAGVCAFPGAPAFADEISAQGFVNVGFERLSFGIVAIHIARKPAEA